MINFVPPPPFSPLLPYKKTVILNFEHVFEADLDACVMTIIAVFTWMDDCLKFLVRSLMWYVKSG